MEQSRFRSIIGFLILVLAIALIAAYLARPTTQPPTVTTTATSTAATSAIATSTTEAPQTVSISNMTFTVPSDYALATTPAQLFSKAYIPPCSTPFDYCLYYIGNTYGGTNFESAGIRVSQRADLATEASCLTTPPAGFTELTATTTVRADYATSVFAPLSNAAAGHYTTGALYRLYTNSTCYEFETRIGETQYANYPAGSIQEFTASDRSAVAAALRQILDGITLTASGAHVTFPTI